MILAQALSVDVPQRGKLQNAPSFPSKFLAEFALKGRSLATADRLCGQNSSVLSRKFIAYVHAVIMSEAKDPCIANPSAKILRGLKSTQDDSL